MVLNLCTLSAHALYLYQVSQKYLIIMVSVLNRHNFIKQVGRVMFLFSAYRLIMV